MSNIRDELAAALLELEGDYRPSGLGCPQIVFSITGADDTLTVPFLRGTATDKTKLTMGGFESGILERGVVRMGHFLTADSTEVTVDSDLFTADNSSARPRVDKLCTFNGRTYRIESAQEDGTGAYIRLELGDPNK